MYTYTLERVKPDWLKIGMAIERAATLAAPIFEANGWEWATIEHGPAVPCMASSGNFGPPLSR